MLPRFDVLDVRTDQGDLAVFDLAHVGHADQFDSLSLAAAHFEVQVALADALAFESRAIGQGNVDLGDRGLEAADFHRLLDHVGMGNVRHHVFVGAHAGGQDFGDVGVGQGGEAPVDAAGGVGRPFGVHFAQRVDEGEDAVLVIQQHALVHRRA